MPPSWTFESGIRTTNAAARVSHSRRTRAEIFTQHSRQSMKRNNPFSAGNGAFGNGRPYFYGGRYDREEYENRLCGENRRHDFRYQRNARRERKAYAGGACKGSDCKRSNGFTGRRCCLIDFTHSYALWRFFKKYLKTT